ncbi:type IV pilus assembly protein PilZ [Ferrimonas sediminum]|uniref:Type IV pilus assembly protein PilZ n=1 Tax=Ferrimonas sediminum TaxID=718193 RepID=A0A1G8VYT5_9GAMM|nr:PilZ domain-containing protein [Ferrimonas sediminum]SDJ71149.1 type IV pilus assembly protein PilZ [Ferrimonas sediminum]
MERLHCQFANANQLYLAYMGFLSEGGLFFPSLSPWQLGQRVCASYRLPDDPQEHRFDGVVVWLNPVADKERPQGVGVRFGDDHSRHRHRIEQVLADQLSSTQLTSTL